MLCRLVVSSETLSGDMRLILEEITRALNVEKLLPCYRFTVTVSCVRALRQLQRFAHLPSDATIFRQYAQYGVFRDVRLASLDCLIDFIRSQWLACFSFRVVPCVGFGCERVGSWGFQIQFQK